MRHRFVAGCPAFFLIPGTRTVYEVLCLNFNAAGAASSPGAAAVPHAPVHATAPAASASTSADYPRLLQQLQDMLQTAAVASICYYRNTAFAAALCDEFGAAAADEGALADAAHYAAASKSLHAVIAAQGSPTSAEALASLLAQAKRAVPQIEAAQAAAKAVKDFSAAAELQNLRWALIIICCNFLWAAHYVPHLSFAQFR